MDFEAILIFCPNFGVAMVLYIYSLRKYGQKNEKKLKLPQNPPNSSFKREKSGLNTEKSKKKKKFFSAFEWPCRIFLDLVEFLLFYFFFP